LWFIYPGIGRFFTLSHYLFLIYITKIRSPLERIDAARLRRLIRKYEFLLQDWEEVEEISKRANQGMSAELHKHRPPGIQPEDFETEEVESPPAEELPQDPPLKKLFRKIVVLCHPDKLGVDLTVSQRAERLDLYSRAVEAHDQRNWALMVVVAIKLGVELPPEAEEQVESIEKRTQELEQRINDATGSITWQWYHAVEEQREMLVQSYLQLLGKLKGDKPTVKGTKTILGLGHPRTGTGYTAKLLQSWGLDVGHERMGEHGTVDWSLAGGGKSVWQEVDFREWNWSHIIYPVRDPRESIASIAGTEQSGASLQFRAKFEPNVMMQNQVASAIVSIVKWDQLIRERGPGVTYRIEDQAEEVFKYLTTAGVEVTWSDEAVGKKWNQREHETFDELLKSSEYVLGRYKRQINEYCDRYGYTRLF